MKLMRTHRTIFVQKSEHEVVLQCVPLSFRGQFPARFTQFVYVFTIVAACFYVGGPLSVLGGILVVLVFTGSALDGMRTQEFLEFDGVMLRSRRHIMGLFWRELEIPIVNVRKIRVLNSENSKVFVRSVGSRDRMASRVFLDGDEREQTFKTFAEHLGVGFEVVEG